MDIIFANRKDCFTSKGGDTIQMLKTKLYLEKKGYNIIICTTPEEMEKYKYVKIIHIFNIQSINDTILFTKMAKKNKQKIVLSPIYWDLSDSVFVHNYFKIFKSIKFLKKVSMLKEIYLKGSYFLKRLFKSENLSNVYLSPDYINLRRFVLENADIIVPNSNEEWDVICNVFSLELNSYLSKVKVVPNAIEIESFEKQVLSNYKDNELLKKISNYVLQVGRIEPNKNQATVIEALMNHPSIPIVFIGAKSDYKYYLLTKKMANKRGNVYFLDELSQETIFDFYKKAAVHVLPSFRESPGLVSLEALFLKTEIVISNKRFCPVEYYQFEKVGHICNPYDKNSVEKAILNALEKKLNTIDREEYFKYYSYERVSHLMDVIYKELV